MSALNNLQLHYLNQVKGLTTMGRGENIRLMLKDAGVDFEYVRFEYANWPAKKKELLSQDIPSPTMPYILIDGKYYGKTLPCMRFIAKKLGKYDGENDDEIQLVDSYADIITDWATNWGRATFVGNENDIKTYKEETAPQGYKTFDNILSRSNGPYLVGDNITYADFTLYHLLEDDNETKIDAEKYPHLAAFVKTIQSRPNLSKYFATDRK